VTVYLVCEGSGPRLDERVLDALVIQAHNLNVLAVSAGGDRGLGPVRAFLKSRSTGDDAISVEDRNYRPRALAQASWANAGAPAFIWRRHEIENYLLHPPVVLALFDDYRITLGTPWAAALPATEADVSALLRGLATPLIENHAGEMLRDELFSLTEPYRLRYRPPAPPAAVGMPAPGQAQWLPALQMEGARLIQACNGVTNLQHLQSAEIAARYQSLLAQSQAPAFFSSDDYLIDLGGKELLASLAHYLQGHGVPGGLNRDELADELLRVLVPIYQPGVIYQPDDFDELATILAQY